MFRGVLIWLATIGVAAAESVVVTTPQAMIDALNEGVEEVVVDGTITFDQPYQESDNALPTFIVTDVIRGRNDGALVSGAPGFRLINIEGPTRPVFRDLEIRGFSFPGDGGAIRNSGHIVRFENVLFIDNHADGHGGAIYSDGDYSLTTSHARFEGNSAGKHGGAIYLAETFRGGDILNSEFAGNDASAGCAIAMDNVDDAYLQGNVFHGDCGGSHVRFVTDWDGPFFHGNTWSITSGSAYKYQVPEERGSVQTRMRANIIARSGGSRPLCRLPPEGGADWPALQSWGSNLATDMSCNFVEQSDAMGLAVSDILEQSGAPAPLPDGPAVDAYQAAYQIPRFENRCALVDHNGLGRPQDGNGDGVFECDIGAIEMQGGPDIGAPQSGAYFDPERPGEGYFVEMLEDGKAWVTFFSFTPIGGSPFISESFPQWFFGTGQVVGNTIVVEDYAASRGAEFSAEFDPEAVEANDVGDLALIFPDCDTFDKAGRAHFKSNSSDVSDVPGHASMLLPTVRLSRIVDCDGEPTSPKAGLSGTFYAPERDGEGVIVQWLSESEAVVIWYTFDQAGNQLWLISDSVSIEGDTITAELIYPATTTAFGRHFNPDEIELAPWGTLTLDYTGCDSLTFSYESVVEGYGSGQYDYQRLTKPAGTSCPEEM